MIIRKPEQEGYKVIEIEGQNVILENEEGGVETWTEYDDSIPDVIFIFEINNKWYTFAHAM